METRPRVGEAVLQGGGLLLRFVRQLDRFQQHLLAVENEQCIELLTSIEGTPGQAWPVSPPLEQLDLVPERAGVQVALLVGMAAGNHWSLSAKLDVQYGLIDFEVACRTSDPPGRLSSTYQLSDDVRARGSVDRLEIASGDVRCRLVHKGDGQGQHGRVEIRGRQLVLEPPTVAETFPTTVCWRYTIERID